MQLYSFHWIRTASYALIFESKVCQSSSTRRKWRHVCILRRTGSAQSTPCHLWIEDKHCYLRPQKPKTRQWYFIAGTAQNKFYIILVRHLASDVELCFLFPSNDDFVSVFSVRQLLKTYVQTWNLLKSISLFSPPAAAAAPRLNTAVEE